MPFHIPGSQMNGPPPHTHLHPVPASFPQLLSWAGHNIRKGGGGVGRVGWLVWGLGLCRVGVNVEAEVGGDAYVGGCDESLRVAGVLADAVCLQVC